MDKSQGEWKEICAGVLSSVILWKLEDGGNHLSVIDSLHTSSNLVGLRICGKYSLWRSARAKAFMEARDDLITDNSLGCRSFTATILTLAQSTDKVRRSDSDLFRIL